VTHVVADVTAYVTVYTLVLIAAVRYMTIVHGARTAPLRRRSRVVAALAVIWVGMLLVNASRGLCTAAYSASRGPSAPRTFVNASRGPSAPRTSVTATRGPSAPQRTARHAVPLRRGRLSTHRAVPLHCGRLSTRRAVPLNRRRPSCAW